MPPLPPDFLPRALAGLLSLSLLPILYRMALLWRAEEMSRLTNANSQASNPGELTLSDDKLRRLCPELYPKPGQWFALWDSKYGGRAADRFLIADQLKHGDTRAALVVSVAPLLIAAYSDDLDAVTLLRFPDEFATDYALQIGQRLVVVNRFWRGGKLAPDLVRGERAMEPYANVQPYLAHFLSDDTEQLQFLVEEIEPEEWERVRVLADDYLARNGQKARDGRPTRSHRPAK
jgi:hypothetical protein